MVNRKWHAPNSRYTLERPLAAFEGGPSRLGLPSSQEAPPTEEATKRLIRTLWASFTPDPLGSPPPELAIYDALTFAPWPGDCDPQLPTGHPSSRRSPACKSGWATCPRQSKAHRSRQRRRIPLLSHSDILLQPCPTSWTEDPHIDPEVASRGGPAWLVLVIPRCASNQIAVHTVH